MEDLGTGASIFNPLPQESQRARIISAIRGRSAMMMNCANAFHFPIFEKTEYTAQPKQSPSDPARSITKKFVGLKSEFSDPVSYLEEFQKISLKGKKDPNVPAIISAEEFFNFANEIGAGILACAKLLAQKISDEFKAKTYETGDINKDECVSIPPLVIFVLERQLGVLNEYQGINIVKRSNGFAGLVLTSGNLTVWSGPETLAGARKAFVDALLVDDSLAIKFKEPLEAVQQKAKEINDAFAPVATRIEEAARLLEVEAQREEHKSKPGFWYNGPEGRLRDGANAATFNRAGSKLILETLIVRRELSRDDMLEILGGAASTAKRRLSDAVGYLNRTFKKNKLNIKILRSKDGIHSLSQKVALDYD